MAKRKAKKRPQARRTARKRTAAPSARAVEAALAGIAHDVRTPLTGIVALAELLAASDLRPREREWANAIKSGADHLAALTSLIVDAAKAEATGLTLRHEPFSPLRLAEAAGAALAARAETRGIKSDIAIARDLPAMVAGDALRLRAALENLADNAVKFTGSGGVAFAASAEPAAKKPRAPHIRGVRQRHRAEQAGHRPPVPALRAGERRCRAPLRRRRPRSRLRQARRQGHGWRTDVISAPGRGSTFRLTALVERADAGPRAEPHALAARGRPLSILCAEDNPYGRVVMNTILTELGHRVDFAETGEAALRAVERGSYDAVLMDVMLPGVGGIEATRRIRALSGKAGQVPVIGISGRGETVNEADARTAGMNFYFAKPVSPEPAGGSAGFDRQVAVIRCSRRSCARRCAPRRT